MPLSSKERQKRFYDKHKNEELFKSTKVKRDRKRRMKIKLDKTKLSVIRLQTKERVSRWRRSKKESKVIANVEPYRSRCSFGKALKKVKDALPSSICKKTAIIKKLATDFGVDVKTNNVQKPQAMLDQNIINYYKRDDVSWVSPNRKDILKTGEQKQYLIMTIQELYSLFCAEYLGMHIGKSKFAALHPINVCTMAEIPHQQCLCHYHENVNLLLLSISSHVPHLTNIPRDGEHLIKELCCDILSAACCYHQNCKVCSANLFKLKYMNDINLDQDVNYQQWSTVDGRTHKNNNNTSLLNVVNILDDKLTKFKKHAYLNKVQKQHFKYLRENLSETSAVIQVDFAKNFQIRNQNEIQSAYFNSQQVSIFTAVVWILNKVESFAVITEEVSHDKYVVFLCFSTIFNYLKLSYPQLASIDIFSDGASSQFKQRYSISALAIYAKKYDYFMRWHFFATSHGKGAVDGVGATIKSYAWRQMKANKVCIVNNAADFANLVSHTSIRVLFEPNNSLSRNEDMLNHF